MAVCELIAAPQEGQRITPLTSHPRARFFLSCERGDHGSGRLHEITPEEGRDRNCYLLSCFIVAMILPWRASWSFPRLLRSEKVGGLASEAIPILCQHHGDAASSHEIPHTVHAWPLKACAALSGVRYFLKDLIAFPLGERIS